MATPRRILPTIILAVALAGIPRMAAFQLPSVAGYPAVGAPATVTLMSPGAAPRAAIRLRIPAGTKETMTMTTVLGINMDMDGMSMPAIDMPTMKMTADMSVTGVADNGDITYEIAFTGLTAEAQPGTDPNMAAMVQASAAGITALRGTFVVSDRGINRSAKLDVTKVADPTLRQLLTSLSGSIESMSMPLPAEPVGVGAKWEVRQAIRNGGAHTFQRAECELVSVDAAAAIITLTIEQTTPPQAIDNAQLPPGATMEIEKMSGSGSGTLTMPLTRLVPTSAISSTVNGAMVVDIGGQTQRMTTQTRIKVSVGSAK
jgi:hypothetical protein